MSQQSTTTRLHIVSAEQELFSGTVRNVSVPGSLGELGIHPRHSPLLTTLAPGEVRFTDERGEEDFIYVSGGMLEVQPEVVTILADVALRGDQIDEEAAKLAKRRAEETMKSAVLYTDRDLARAELLKAVAQLQTLRDLRKKRGRPTM
ncbi:F0F1 ATP synthase subunit epsilon [Endothiovibrio diazotrophicus]